MFSVIVNYLIRLRYSDNKVGWVSTAFEVNECVVTTNGRHRSAAYFGEEIKHAYETGRWGGFSSPTSCASAPGHRGQEKVIVPPGADGLTLCRFHDGELIKHLDRATAKQLAAAASALPTRPNDFQCDGPTGGPEIRMIFHYPIGPPAEALLWSGRCGVENLYVEAGASPQLLELLAELP
ncbi:hypothetical protein [Sinosporangium siamense]|uniref:hypothetical protein n=1 Tax=Sinosporangium siamense TaxID=1367973 RepID=UPI00194EFDE0|nr:hypothetical protein [Sinosporangium siamense]